MNAASRNARRGARSGGLHAAACGARCHGALPRTPSVTTPRRPLCHGALRCTLSVGALRRLPSFGALRRMLSVGALRRMLSVGALRRTLSTGSK